MDTPIRPSESSIVHDEMISTADESEFAAAHGAITPLGVARGGDHANDLYKYSPNIPVKKLASRDVVATVERFRKSAVNYIDSRLSVGDKGKDGELPARSGDTQLSLNYMKLPDHYTHFDTYSYPLGPEPVALMQLDLKTTPPDIAQLATHARVADGGTTMVEYAVNRSQEMGQEGRVRANPLNESTEFFESLGFRQGGEPEGLYAPPFVLDPKHSTMWRQNQNDGTWSLDKHEHQKYLTANRPVENVAHADDGAE